MKKIIIGFVCGILFCLGINLTQKIIINSKEVLFKVKILNEYINVRDDHSTQGKYITEVLMNEEYEVIEQFDSEYYTWYKIKISDRRTGWIASSNDLPWIEVI